MTAEASGRRLGKTFRRGQEGRPGDGKLWGRGHGHQAVVLAVGHAFDVLGLERITAEVFADNPRSVRLLEGTGFVREGVMRESIHRDGRRVDELVYGLLRREWSKGHK
ncbi:GNAT family N-acetyltransferase [Streptomyces finlayi]|uniref:GNAT family N-acetyltransferase n=1 Tax=Streptomyces finlayi TaxID=67296 RepID=UPI001629634E|nr:GNAT family protein [Streptomyces finlayi]